jgi:hypothetical protein
MFASQLSFLMEICWDIYSGRFVYCYRCVSLEFTDTRSNISTEIKWPSRAAISTNIRREIFHGEITIGLHILGLNRDYYSY